MLSYQYRDSHVKDKTVSPAVLSLTWESPYLGKTVFILRRGPVHYHFQCQNQRNITPFHFWSGKSLNSLSQTTLRWRHNGCNSVSNHQPHHCLLNRLFRRRSKKTSKLRVTGLCAVNSPGTGEFSAQMASNAENVSIWWRHHDRNKFQWNFKQDFCIFIQENAFESIVCETATILSRS